MPDPRPASQLPQSQIGWVENLEGTVTVRHADGSAGNLHKGDTVFQGDQVHTDSGSKIGLVFLDHSTFLLSANGKIVLDEMIFDPHTPTAGAKSVTSVITGAFAMSSGQIAHDHPGAQEIHTPTLTIGIRGTTLAGEVAADGSLIIALLTDTDGTVGEIELHGLDGSVATVNAPGLGLTHYTGGPLAIGPVDIHILATLAATLPSGSSEPPPGIQGEPPPPPPPEPPHSNDNPNLHGDNTPFGGGNQNGGPGYGSQTGGNGLADDTGGASQPHVYGSNSGPSSFSGSYDLYPHGSGTLILQGIGSSNTLFAHTDVLITTPTWTFSGNAGQLVLQSNDSPNFQVTATNIQTLDLGTNANPVAFAVGQDGANVTLTSTTSSDATIGIGSGIELSVTGSGTLAVTGKSSDLAQDQLTHNGGGLLEVTLSDTVHLTDSFFANITSSQTSLQLTSNVSGQSVVLGSKAEAAGVSTVILENTAGGTLVDASAYDASHTIIVDAQTSTNNTLLGGAGNDLFIVGASVLAGDVINGGAGNNSIILTDPTNLTDSAFANVSDIGTLAIASSFSGTITLGADAQATGIIIVDAVANGETLTIDASAMTHGLTILGGTGTENIAVATAELSNDTILGGSGADSLTLVGAGGLTDSDFAHVTGISSLAIDPAFSGTFTLGADMQASGITSVDISNTTGAVTIDGTAFTSGLTITAGSGADTLLGGSGNDTFIVAASALSGDTINGHSGSNSLDLTGAGSITDTAFANVHDIQSLTAEGSGTVTLGSTAFAAGLTHIDTSADSATTTIDASLAGAPVTIVTGAGNANITVLESALSSDVITGGGGANQLSLLFSDYPSPESLSDSAFANVSHIQSLTIVNDTLDPNIALGADAQAAGITSVAVVDNSNSDSTSLTVTTASIVTVDASGTSGTVAINDQTAQVLTLIGGSGHDSFTVAASGLAGDHITGGGGSDLLDLTGTPGTITDAAFANVHSIGTLELGSSFIGTVQLDNNAQTAGITTIDNASSDGSAVTIEVAASALAGDTIAGGGGTLDLTGPGPVSVGAFDHVTNIPTVALDSTFSGALTLGADAQSAGVTTVNGAATSGAVTVDGTAFTSGLSITAGSGAETLLGGSGNDTFIAAASVLSGDTINGHLGINILDLTGAGSIADTSFANVHDIQTLNVLGSGTVSLASDAFAAGITHINASADSGTTNINATSAVSPLTIVTGGGNDSFTVAASGLAGDAITGGGGSDLLDLTGATPVVDSAFANIHGIQTLDVLGSGTVSLASDAFASGLTHIDTSADGGAATIDASTVAASQSLSIVTGSGNDSFTVGMAEFQFSAGNVSINAGAGSNSLTLTGSTTTIADGDFVHISHIQSLTVDNTDSSVPSTDVVLGTDATAAGITSVIVTDADSNAQTTVTLQASSTSIAAVNASDSNGTVTIDAHLTSWDMTLTGGLGNDSFIVAADHLGDYVISGGTNGNLVNPNINTLHLTGTGTVSAGSFASVTNVGTLALDSSFNGNVTLGDDATTAGITTVDASAVNATVYIDASADQNPGMTFVLSANASSFANGSDTIKGYNDLHNTLSLTGSTTSTVNDTSFAQVTNIGTLALSSTFGGSVTLGGNAQSAGITTVDASATSNQVSIDASQDPNAGMTFVVSANAASFTNGDDTFTGYSHGSNTLRLSGGTATSQVYDGSFDQVTNVGTLAFSSTFGGSVQLGSNAENAGFTNVDASATNNQVYVDASQDQNTGMTFVVSANASSFTNDNDTFTGYSHGNNSLRLTGGTATSTVADSAFGNVTNVGTLVLDSTFNGSVTLGSDAKTAGFLTVDASTTTASVTIDALGSSQNLAIIAGTGQDTILGGTGNDTVTVNLPAYSSGALANDTITGGYDGNVDHPNINSLILSGSSVTVLNSDFATIHDIQNLILESGVDGMTVDVGSYAQSAGISGVAIADSFGALTSLTVEDQSVTRIDASASSGSVNIDASGTSQTLTILAGIGHDALLAGTGADTFVVSANALTLNEDTITGQLTGNNTYTLDLTGSGTVTDAAFTNVSSIGNGDNITGTLELGASFSGSVQMGSNAFTAGFSVVDVQTSSSVTVDAHADNASLTFNAGSEPVALLAGPNNDSVNDFNVAASALSTDMIFGGHGNNTLVLTGSTNVTDASFADVFHISTLSLTSDFAGTLTIGTDAALAGITDISASGNQGTIQLAANALAGYTSVLGGDGTLDLTGAGPVVNTAFQHVSNFYNLALDSTYTGLLTLDADAQTTGFTIVNATAIGGAVTINAAADHTADMTVMVTAGGLAGDHITGGGVTDFLDLTGAGPVADAAFANIHGFGVVELGYGFTGTITLGADAAAAGITDIINASGNPVTIQLAGSSLAGESVAGGGGTLDLTGAGPVTGAAFNHVTNIATLALDSTYTGLLTLGADAQNAGFTIVNATAIGGAVSINAAADHTSDMAFMVTASGLAGDSITGGGVSDILDLTGAGPIVDTAFVSIHGFGTLALGSSYTGTLTLGGDAQTEGFATIDASAIAGAVTINAAADEKAGMTVVVAANGLFADSITGGSGGTDILELTGTGTVSDSAFLNAHHFATLDLGSSFAGTVQLGADAQAEGITTINASNTSGSLEIQVAASALATDTITGGNGVFDNLSLTGSGTVLDSAFQTISDFTSLQLSSTFAGGTITLGAHAQATGIASVDASQINGAVTVDVSADHNANTTVLVSASAFSTFNDTITGSGTTDGLFLAGTGTVVDANFLQVSGIDNVLLGSGFNGSLQLGADAQATGIVNVNASVDNNAVTINAAADHNSGLTFMVTTAALSSNEETITGYGAGNNVLDVTGSGTITDAAFAHLSHIGTVDLASGFTGTIALGADAAAAGITTLNATATSSPIIVEVAAGSLAGDTITGGSGTNVLQLTGNGAASDSAFGNIHDIQTLMMSDNTNVTLGTDALATGITSVAITGSSGNTPSLTVQSAETAISVIDALGSSGTVSIDAQDTSQNLVIIAGSGSDILKGGTGNDSFVVAATTLSSDTVTGESNENQNSPNINTLHLTGPAPAGEVSDGAFANVTGIEVLALDSTFSGNVQLAYYAQYYAGFTAVNAAADANALTIDTTGDSQNLKLTAGHGADEFLLATNALAGDTIIGNSLASNTSLDLMGTGSIIDSAFNQVSHVAGLILDSSFTGTLTLGEHAQSAGITSVDASEISGAVTIDAAADHAADMTFIVAASSLTANSDAIAAGNATDILRLTGATTQNVTSTALGAVTNIGTLALDATFSGSIILSSSKGISTIDASATSNQVTIDASQDQNTGMTFIVSANASPFVNGYDSIAGYSDGHNTLRLTGGTATSQVYDGSFAQVTNIGTLALDATFSGSVQLGYYAQNDAGFATVDASATTGSVTIDASSFNSSLDIIAGSGADSVIVAAASLSGDTIIGGGGGDVLHLTGAGTGNDTDFVHVYGVGTLALDSSYTTGTLTLAADAQYAGFSVVDAHADNNALTIDFSADSRILDVSTGSGNDSFIVAAASLAGDTISGGGGADVLHLTGAGPVTDSAFAHISGISTLALDNGFSGTVTLAADAHAAGITSIDTSNDYSSVTVDASAIDSNLAFTFNPNAIGTFTGGAGNDSFTANLSNTTDALANKTINGGEGTNSLFLIGGSTSVYDGDFANVTHIQSLTVDTEGFIPFNITLGNDAASSGITSVTVTDSGTTNLSLQTTAITNVNAVSATGTLGLDASLDTSTALTVTAGSGSDTFALNHSGTVSFSNFTEAHDSLQLDNSQFNLGTSGTLANSQFAEATSAHQMSATAQNYAENTSAGIIVINDVSGPGSSVWYTTNLENASTANSHEIAHLTINTSAIDHSAFHLAV